MIHRVVIVDGYTDEPAGLGVPPYMNTYPRLVAGALWLHDPSIDIRYWTIDEVRLRSSLFIKQARDSDIIVFIAGSEVPGKYIGGAPIKQHEVEILTYSLRDKIKILVGPAARYGFGLEGGSLAISRDKLKNLFDVIVTGDPEIYFQQLMLHGFEKSEPWRLRENYDYTDRVFIKGSRIIAQHPNYGWNLVVEIETFRGCPRWIVGGCSFCIEPRYGEPVMRSVKGVVDEVTALYNQGARHFRLGKQPDILVYGSREIGDKEFPKPDPEVLEKLFYGIRNVAPGLRVLHIDNVNPGTIVHNPEESIKSLKIIIKYHTPGDVAALGIESFDEKVVKANNLKVYPDEALGAVRIINKYGGLRGWNGLPHLLPGINLLHGLPGETRETFKINLLFLQKILDENLYLRRINVRMVSILENTPLWVRREDVLRTVRKHRSIYRRYRKIIMMRFDKKMLSHIAPKGCVLRYLYTEKHRGNYTYARIPGSYPILVKIRGEHVLKKIVDVRVRGVAAKSVVGEIV